MHRSFALGAVLASLAWYSLQGAVPGDEFADDLQPATKAPASSPRPLADVGQPIKMAGPEAALKSPVNPQPAKLPAAADDKPRKLPPLDGPVAESPLAADAAPARAKTAEPAVKSGKAPVPAKDTASPANPPASKDATKPSSDSKKTPASPADLDKTPAEAVDRAKPPLSPEMTALRDRVRHVVAHSFRQPINTNDNTPAEVLEFCVAFGCDTEVRYGSSAGNAMNGIGCLCFNYPCANYHMLVVSQRKVMARVGYALQQRPGHLLATLAESAVPETYELRAGDWRGTVSDLLESEKLGCMTGMDLSQKLVGLAYYLPDGATWKNLAGDSWSLERMVREELNRSPATYGPEAVSHLVGLTYAVDRHCRAGRPCEGQYERAKKFLSEYEGYVFSLQNADGSWHPDFFAAKGTSRDVSGTLRATGHILEWLAMVLPEPQLQDHRIVSSVNYVTKLLDEPYANLNVTATSTREIAAVMHAVHALRIYDRRVFKNAGPDKSETPPAETAGKRNPPR
jgi:hypothetical protein